MVIIDLDTGQLVDEGESTSAVPTPAQIQPSAIIDLDSGSLISQELEAQPSTQPEPTFKPSPFPEEREETRAVEELPELGQGGLLSTEDTSKVVGLAPVLLATTNNEEIADIIQDNFKSIGKTFDPGGNILLTNNETGAQVVVNKPGLSRLDLLQGLGIAAAFTPAGKGATLGGAAISKGLGLAGAKAVGATAAAGAATSGLTQAAIEAIQSQVGGELNEEEIAIAAALGGAVETVIPAIQGIRQARKAKALGAQADELADVAQTIRPAQEASERTGIPLFQAQQTAIPAQLEKQSFVAQLPAGTRSAVKGLKTQNKAAGEAVENFLNAIAPPEAVVTGQSKFRTAAQNAVEKAKNIRAEKTSPLYTDAFAEGASVDTKPVKDFIAVELSELPESGQISKSLKKVDSLITPKEGQEQTLRFLHNAKLEIDQMLKGVGPDSLGNTTKAKLTEAKGLLLSQIDDASTSYKAAREAFSEASPAVTKMQDSLIGKIAALDDTQLKQISGKIFDPAQTNPQVILKAKKAITDVDPDAWTQLVRVELEKRLGAVKTTAEGGTIENIPGQLFRAIFPNNKSEKVLMNGLDQEARRNLVFLKTALGRARLGRPGGSQTAGREEIKKELRGGVSQSIRNFFDSPLKSLGSAGVSTVTGATADAAFNRRAAALSKALFDPTWKAEMKQLRQLNPNSPAAARAMAQLLKDIESSDKENK